MVDRGFPSWYFLSRTDVLRNNYRVSNSSYLPHSGQHYIFSCQQTMIDLTVTFHVAIEAKPEHLEEAFYHYHVRSEFAPRDLGIDHIRPRDSLCTLRRRICSSHPHPPPLSPLRPQVRFPSHLKHPTPTSRRHIPSLSNATKAFPSISVTPRHARRARHLVRNHKSPASPLMYSI